jgi:glyoxylase-like metal-dependent hydrolase (beta-lactamase superfamily II)
LALVRHDADLWSSEYPLRWQGGLVAIPVRMTVIRLAGGQLVLHSPGPLTPELGAELDALGRVAFIVVPQAHGKFAAPAAERFPAARLLAAPGAPWRQKSLPFHGSLADRPPEAWAGQLESHLLRGFRLGEVVLFHRASRTLVLTDLCFNIQHAASPLARLFFRLNGMWRRFGPSRLIRYLAVSDRSALEASLEQVLRWDFERILPGHGEVIDRGGRAALRAAWSRPRRRAREERP